MRILRACLAYIFQLIMPPVIAWNLFVLQAIDKTDGLQVLAWIGLCIFTGGAGGRLMGWFDR